jgi:mycothione reductase
MELQPLPRRLVIIGGGYVGLESAAIYTGLSSEVVARLNSFMVGRTDNISVRFSAMVAGRLVRHP